jgi:hypothetical protein
MDDTTKLLVANLIEALQQLQHYIVIGLGTSVSALALTSKSVTRDHVVVPGVPVAVAPDIACAILLAVSFLVGAMASYAAETANLIAARLSAFPALLTAACTFPSVATSPYIGVRALAAALPFIFSVAAVVRVARPYRAGGRETILGGVLLFGAAYGALALALFRPGALASAVADAVHH